MTFEVALRNFEISSSKEDYLSENVAARKIIVTSVITSWLYRSQKLSSQKNAGNLDEFHQELFQVWEVIVIIILNGIIFIM